jgi:uncharacterized iron-regulated membrane protein
MSSAGSPTSKLYRAIWRWHFYAGLVVAPFLLILAVTGSIYLFNDEINDWLHPEYRFVQNQGPAMPVSHWIEAALEKHPGAVTRVDLPATPDRPGVVFITPDKGEPVRVVVEPATMEVLGSYIYARTLVGFADEMHGSLTIGTLGDRIVELAACWALVLLVTGIYLWWPRGAAFNVGGVVFPRLRLRGTRAAKGHSCRDRRVDGAADRLPDIDRPALGGGAGRCAQARHRHAGIGYPASNRGYGAPQSVPMKTALKEAPWTLEDAPMPVSKVANEHAGHPGHDIAVAGNDPAAVAGVDRITDVLWARGLTGGYRLFLPAGPTGIYTAYTYPDQPQGQRTLYFDRYTARLIKEVSYRDYGWGAKAIELGVQLHMGNYFGRANQILMLVPCIGIVLLVISGFWMWWKRKPDGKLAAPPKVPGARLKIAIGLMAAAGVVLPLFGASLIAVFALDRMAVMAKRI